METQNQKIDFVILWVDGNDPEWKKQKDNYFQQCFGNTKDENGDNRFREWDQLKYWFRGVEKNAPWVNKIHFVTWGHLPKWLNTAHPKLHIVRHEEIIPNQFLPVFSSHAIEICINRIKGLSERFVYFNDDLFLLAPVPETMYFQDGLPRCDASLHPFPTNAPAGHFYSCINLQNMNLINRNFSCCEVIRKHWRRFIHPTYGYYRNKSTLLYLPWRRRYFPFFIPSHSPSPFLKSVFDEVWEKEEKALLNTCGHRFRSYDDVNQYLFTYWQICEGRFFPTNPDAYFTYTHVSGDLDRICQIIMNPDKPSICINDNVKDWDIFIDSKEKINRAFDTLFPKKCSFEI